jgi:hypothetical protein
LAEPTIAERLLSEPCPLEPAGPSCTYLVEPFKGYCAILNKIGMRLNAEQVAELKRLEGELGYRIGELAAVAQQALLEVRRLAPSMN